MSVTLPELIAHVARETGMDDVRAGKRVRSVIRGRANASLRECDGGFSQHLATRSKGDRYSVALNAAAVKLLCDSLHVAVPQIAAAPKTRAKRTTKRTK